METQTISQSKKVRINWAIPVRSIYSMLILLFLIPFTILNFIYVFIPGIEEIENHEGNFAIEDIGYLWLPILCYALSISTLFLVVRIFIPLKSKLLTNGVIYGIFSGIIGGILMIIFFNFTMIECVLLGTAVSLCWTLYLGLGLEQDKQLK